MRKRLSAADRRPSLVLWGSTGPGEVTLDPAIVLDAVPSLPEAGGPYRMVTDRATGRIRRLLGDFDTTPVAGPGEVVTVSRGLPEEK